jgi:hypothetical protein
MAHGFSLVPLAFVSCVTEILHILFPGCPAPIGRQNYLARTQPLLSGGNPTPAFSPPL